MRGRVRGITLPTDTLTGMRGRSKNAKEPPEKKRSGGNKASAVLSLLGAFVATSVVLGLLTAGLALPLAGLGGTGVKSGIKLFNEIPDSFTENALSQQSRILAADGSVIATPSDENRVVVTSAQIPKVMKDAQVAIEDERFYQHGALDQRGLARAVASNLFSSSTQGASTLTQQYVKVADQRRALASGDKKAAADAVSQTGTKAYVRKVKQLKYAVELEKTHSKDQILTSYLNLVYFGDQQYGIEAAARHYFGHPAKDLTVAEAATLAGVVNLPTATNPIKNPKAAKIRRDIVIRKMLKQRMITSEQAAQAIATPIKTKSDNVSIGCASSKYPYYCDYVMSYLSSLPQLGKTPKERIGKIQTGGYTIQTAMDPKKMKVMESDLKKRVPQGNAADVQAAAVLVEPGTGLVPAIGQNTKYDLAGENASTTAINYAESGFPIGSTAKIFAIIEAMRQGRAIDSTIDVPRMNSTRGGTPVKVFTSQTFGGKCGIGPGQKWTVGNDHQVPAGPMKLEKATAESVNTAFAALVAQLGPCKVRDTYGLFGVKSTWTGKPITPDPSSIVLGSDPSSPMMMANTFATVAADGKYCPPRPVKSITDGSGKKLNLPDGCKQVISKEEARGVAKIFRAVLDAPDGTAHVAKLSGGRQAFGKTGTVDDSKHTWFVGATPQLSTAVWVGRAGDNPNPIKNVTIGGKHIDTFLYGGDIAAPAWKSMMDSFSKDLPKKKFPEPNSSTKKGDQITIPKLKGKSAEEAHQILAKLKLQVTTKKQSTNEKVDSGQVFRVSPDEGKKIGEGKKVTIYVKQ